VKQLNNTTWETYKKMMDNARSLRATIHQLITHPESDNLPDRAVMEALASYRDVINSLISVTTKLHEIGVKDYGRSFIWTGRIDTLKANITALRKGTF
jgi:hypothetical protein